MNKKAGVFIVLLVVATLALPLSFVSASKPETKTLTGTFVTPYDPSKVTIITIRKSTKDSAAAQPMRW